MLDWIKKMIGMVTATAESVSTAAGDRVFDNTGYRYEDDALYPARSYDSRIVPKNMAVIHFSWSRDLIGLSRYFSEQIPPNTANATFGVGKDGVVHRYLPDPGNPAWTNNGIVNGRGIYAKFVTPDGRFTTGQEVNNTAVAFEVVNINYEPYTDQQMEAVVRRLLWMLDRFPDFRAWRVAGHEHLVPLAKDDPGGKWDWHEMFRRMRVREDFYREYLAWLADTAFSTVGDPQRTARKQAIIDDALLKIARDLSGKPKGFCF